MSIKVSVAAAMGLALAALAAPAQATAATQVPAWQITSVSEPTNPAPGDVGDELIISAVNIGGRATDGSTITLSDTLPLGLSTQAVVGADMLTGRQGIEGTALPCSSTQTTATCTDSQIAEPGDVIVMRITVAVEAPTGATLTNHAIVAGGGGETATASAAIAISTSPAAPGIAPGSLAVGLSTTQAGAHPNLTTTFAFNTSAFAHVSAAPKDTLLDLPVGLVGNTVGITRCPIADIEGGLTPCPRDSIVGTAVVAGRSVIGGTGYKQLTSKVFNIAPSPGEPAAFAFAANEGVVRLDTKVLSDGNYGVQVATTNLSERNPALWASVTIWGIPSDHNGPGPEFEVENNGGLGGPGAGARVPLLSNPTQCSEPLTASLATDAWTEPGAFREPGPAHLGLLSGCDGLPFPSTVSMLPDTLQAGAPAGYSLDLTVSREQDLEPEGLAAADAKDVTAALPVGTVISPSSATGLVACSDEDFFGPEQERGLAQPATLGACPRESQIGTVRIKTPALEEALTGEVYLGSPSCDPCTPVDAQDGQMVRLFVQASSEGEGGIVIKLEGTASINQQTGQITATFKDNPQLPFSDFKMSLTGGPRATLANPGVCGPATTSVDLTPWSTPFTLDSTPTSTFEVTGCSGARFAPSFTAGTTNNQAGGFSPLTVAFGRSDADQDLNGIQMTLPPGLLGSIASVPLCREAQAMAGTCGEESLIGTTQVLTGPGSEPFLVTGGKVFLTEGYKGAPYGLSIVVPAKAGPYTLAGSTGTGLVVVRAAINVDPHTAALTVTSDPLPSVLNGIPLALKVVNVTIGRPGFISNPTDCNPLAITATLTSVQGASASVSSPFQVSNCAALAFKPQFLVSTSGRTSKLGGASLDAKVIFPSGSQTHGANIAKVKVDLPKQLPSRLTTLQKACLAATFEANPGLCPAASIIGVARASSPILPVQLTGPVYFVSHGGEEFPALIMVLQGDGVRVDVVGKTFISHAGITSNTFNNVPDVPISSFELYLPEGRYSALGANANLCTSKLTMPTAFIAQNGTEIHQNTKITVTECPKTKPKKKHQATKAGKAQQAAHPEHGRAQ
jgi:hypothetical protein